MKSNVIYFWIIVICFACSNQKTKEQAKQNIIPKKIITIPDTIEYCLSTYSIVFEDKPYQKDSIDISQAFDYDTEGNRMKELFFYPNIYKVDYLYTKKYNSDKKIQYSTGICKIIYQKNYADSTLNKIIENQFNHLESFYKSGKFICQKQNQLIFIDINQCPNDILAQKLVVYLKKDTCFDKIIWIPCGGHNIEYLILNHYKKKSMILLNKKNIESELYIFLNSLEKIGKVTEEKSKKVNFKKLFK